MGALGAVIRFIGKGFIMSFTAVLGPAVLFFLCKNANVCALGLRDELRVDAGSRRDGSEPVDHRWRDRAVPGAEPQLLHVEDDVHLRVPAASLQRGSEVPPRTQP